MLKSFSTKYCAVQFGLVKKKIIENPTLLSQRMVRDRSIHVNKKCGHYYQIEIPVLPPFHSVTEVATEHL